MKRLWIALTAFTAGLWLLLWRFRRRPSSAEDAPEVGDGDDAVENQYAAPIARTNLPLSPTTPMNRAAANNEASVSLASLVPDVRRARFIQNVGLAIFGVVLGLVFVWLGGRFFFGEEQQPQPEVFVPSVAVAGCTPAAGDWMQPMQAASFEFADACSDYFWNRDPFGEFYYNVQLNNYGFHDTPFTLEKPAGVYRILIIGDLFPRGEEVPMTSGFPYLLERQFNVENDGSRPNIEIINLSIPAIGTDRELLLYAGLGWQFQADVVILCVYTGNDIRDNDIDMEHLQYSYRLTRPFFTLESGVLALHDSRVPLEATRFPDAPAWQWFVNMQSRQTTPPSENPPQRPLILSRSPYRLEYPVDLGLYLPEDPYWARSWQLTESLLLQFRDLVLEQGSRFGVVIIPDRRAVHPEDWTATVQQYPIVQSGNPLAPIARLSLFMQQSGMITLNLTTALREAVTELSGVRFYYVNDGHFNLNGHLIASQAIHDWLLLQGLIPGLTP